MNATMLFRNVAYSVVLLLVVVAAAVRGARDNVRKQR